MTTRQANHRITTTAVATATVVFSSFFAAGCGSGGGSSSSSPSPSTAALTDTTGALRDVQTGQTALNRLLTTGGTPSASDLQTVSGSFASAHAKDPNNAEASVLLGLTQIAAAAEDVAAASSLSPNGGKAVTPLAGGVDLRLRRLPDLKNDLISPRSMWLRLVLSTPLLVSGKGSGSRAVVDEARVRAALQNLQNTITSVLPLIQKGADKADFGFVFTDFETKSGGVRVLDQADVTAILAALYDTRAGLQIALAYKTDTAGFDFGQTVGDRFSAKNAGDTVTPADYLPVLPFGTLLNDGKDRFTQARADLISGADTSQTALTRLQSRSTNVLHLINSSDITPTQYTEAALAFTGLKASLNGPVTVPLGGKSITFNLKAWFDNPPQNVRSFLPTYTVGVDGSGRKVLQATAASYPDLTFDGLIPSTTGFDTTALAVTIPADQSVSSLLEGFLAGLDKSSGSL